MAWRSNEKFGRRLFGNAGGRESERFRIFCSRGYRTYAAHRHRGHRRRWPECIDRSSDCRRRASKSNCRSSMRAARRPDCARSCGRPMTHCRTATHIARPYRQSSRAGSACRRWAD
ncbi:MAG: hypothetical protein KGI68_07695 [Alphaproteobacteria bacterium]|nr:hypothetical protein [Alphaproteobacteria bacterium]